MKIAYLGPFSTSTFYGVIPTLTEMDCINFKGMNGHALDNIVKQRLIEGKPTTVITLDDKIDKPLIKKYGIYSLYCLPKRKKHALKDFFKNERRLICEAINDDKPDLLHVHWTYEYALSVAAVKHLPKLLTIHDNAFDILKYQKQLWYILYFLITIYVINKFDYISVVSDYINNFVRKVRVRPLKSYTIPNIITLPINNLNNNTRGKRKLTFIYSGGWNELKNPKCALVAFNIYTLKNDNAELLMIGEGLAKGSEGYNWAKIKGYDKNVKFIGKIAHSDFLRLLKYATIYLHTSKIEAMSLAIAEAMMLKIPIIAGIKSGGVPIQLGNGTFGWLVDINRPLEIVDAIYQVLNGKHTKNKVDEAYRYIIKYTNPKTVLENYENIYKQIMLEKLNGNFN